MILTYGSVYVYDRIGHQIDVVAEFALQQAHDFGAGQRTPFAVRFHGREELQNHVTFQIHSKFIDSFINLIVILININNIYRFELN